MLLNFKLYGYINWILNLFVISALSMHTLTSSLQDTAKNHFLNIYHHLILQLSKFKIEEGGNGNRFFKNKKLDITEII